MSASEEEELFDFDLPHRLVYVLQEPLDFSIIFVDKLPGFFVLSHQIVFQGVPALVQICTHLVHSQVSTGGVFQLWPQPTNTKLSLHTVCCNDTLS